MPGVVLESNALGDPDTGLEELWTERQRAAAAAAGATTTTAGGVAAAAAAAVCVRAASADDVRVDDLVPGVPVDGVALSAGDRVLLTGQQRDPTENGVWQVGPGPGGPLRIAAATTAGGLFYVAASGGLYACTGPNAVRRVWDSLAAAVDATAAALQRPVPIARIAPPYADAVVVTVTREWLRRCNHYCPSGAAPAVAPVQTLRMGVVLAEGEEIEVYNGSPFPLTVEGASAGTTGPAAGVAVWDDARTRAYGPPGQVVGLGTSIVPNGAAVLKQLTSGSIGDAGATPAVTALVGALDPS